jgi:hypothetical protein
MKRGTNRHLSHPDNDTSDNCSTVSMTPARRSLKIRDKD